MRDMEEPVADLAVKKDNRYRHHDTGLSWLLILLVMILLAVAVSIFNGGSDAPGDIVGPRTPTPSPEDSSDVRPPRLYVVSYKSGVFSPTNLRLHSGDTVRFHNDSTISIRIASDPHPQHNNLVGFDSIGDIPPGSNYTFTFAAKGTFGYHNENELSETGTIIVR